jgi:DNA polymerase I-like protein with 3'-5' exonuclease and polymerase domains
LLSPFGARTGRNTPSNTKFTFGPSVWVRGLIRPEPGRALAYLDWAQQEIGIAAALSGDEALIAAVRSGDPYLAFAVQAALAPAGATKDTHGPVRDACKACVLGIGYGMAEHALAGRIGCTPIEARELLELHARTYPRFWCWSEAAIDSAMLQGWIETVFGWRLHVGEDVNPRSLRNFPMQANGAEMLRLACSLATERGVEVIAPVHDAILIEAPEEEIEAAVAGAKRAMQEASCTVLGGFELTVEAKVVCWPERYCDRRGALMWRRVMGILGQLEVATLHGVDRFSRGVDRFSKRVDTFAS